MSEQQTQTTTEDTATPQTPVFGGRHIFTALAKAQGELKHASKDGINPHFRSKYASLASVIDSYRKVLAKHGLCVIQQARPHDRGVIVATTIGHASGEYISDEGVFVPASKNDAQGFGSALTYARRYGLSALIGIAPDDDDDGNAAVASTRQPAQRAAASVQNTRQAVRRPQGGA
jgi:hypothetical protein